MYYSMNLIDATNSTHERIDQTRTFAGQKKSLWIQMELFDHSTQRHPSTRLIFALLALANENFNNLLSFSLSLSLSSSFKTALCSATRVGCLRHGWTHVGKQLSVPGRFSAARLAFPFFLSLLRGICASRPSVSRSANTMNLITEFWPRAAPGSYCDSLILFSIDEPVMPRLYLCRELTSEKKRRSVLSAAYPICC